MSLSLLLRLLLWLVIAAVLFEAVRSARLIWIGRAVAARSVPFERRLSNADFRILVVGDSTARGTGAGDPSGSVAGGIGAIFPEASIENRGVNGARTAEIVAQVPLDVGQPYDLLVVHAGGNDILRFTPLQRLQSDLETLLDRAVKAGEVAVLLTAGNVGLAPFFSPPIGWIYTARTRRVRQMFMETARAKGAHYVDLFTERKDDVFLTDPPRYYAPDFLHPSSEGYRVWFLGVVKVLRGAGVRGE